MGADTPPQPADAPPPGADTPPARVDTGPHRDEATPAADSSWFDSALVNRESEIVPAWPTYAAPGSSDLAVGDPGVIHAEHEVLGGPGDRTGLAVDLWDGKSAALQGLDAPSIQLAEEVLATDRQPGSDGRYEIQFPMYRTETSAAVGQLFSPTPPEADFDAYARRVGLPDVSRTTKPDVIVAHLLTDETGSKHFITGHTLPYGLTDQAAANLTVSSDADTGAARYDVTPDSFRVPGGDLNIVAETGWYTVTERIPWDDYIARRDEFPGT